MRTFIDLFQQRGKAKNSKLSGQFRRKSSVDFFVEIVLNFTMLRFLSKTIYFRWRYVENSEIGFFRDQNGKFEDVKGVHPHKKKALRNRENLFLALDLSGDSTVEKCKIQSMDNKIWHDLFF